MFGPIDSVLAGPPDTRSVAEKMANRLQFFATREFLYDRQEFREFPLEVVKEHVAALTPLWDVRHTVDSWVALLEHPDARVRTLALAALFAREDPKLLPHLASRLEDKAQTFPHPSEPLSAHFLPPKFDAKALKTQSVGEAAASMIAFYMEHADGHAPHLKPTLADFKVYWDARKDRSHCASWYGVKLSRASQGSWPLGKSRIERVRAVRAEIDKLPDVERAWVLLSLLERQGREHLISDQELEAAAKHLGRDRLLGLLRRQANTDDPDWTISQRTGTWGYILAVQFVLTHADKLLRPEDGLTLLHYEAAEIASIRKGNSNPIQTASWAIGAAQLQPDKASAILRDAFDRFQEKHQTRDRAQLALALWRVRGPEEAQFLLDWFYKEEPGLGEIGFGRPGFLASLPGVRAPDDRKLLAAIVGDDRFETMDWQSLRQLIEVLNGWTQQPVVRREELERASHPFGMSHFTNARRQKAMDQYPKETQTLLDTLHTWRTAVRASLPRWK